MKAVRSTKTWASFYQTTRHHILECSAPHYLKSSAEFIIRKQVYVGATRRFNKKTVEGDETEVLQCCQLHALYLGSKIMFRTKMLVKLLREE